MAVKDLPKGMDPKIIGRMIETSRAQYESLEKAWDALLEKHENEWVAAYQGDFVFGESLDDVLAKATKSGWPLGVIAIDQLRRERADILL